MTMRAKEASQTPRQAKPLARGKAKAAKAGQTSENVAQAQASNASEAAAAKPRSQRAKAPSLPFPIESLNRGRPGTNLPEDVFLMEDWRSVPGARMALASPPDFLASPLRDLAPNDYPRLIMVPGSHAGGAALAQSVRERLAGLFRMIVSDWRWKTARSHKAVHVLAEAAHFAQNALLAILEAFDLANRGSGLTAMDRRRLADGVRMAETVVQTLARSEKYKALHVSASVRGKKGSAAREAKGVATERRVLALFEKHRSMRTRDQTSRVRSDLAKGSDGLSPMHLSRERIGQIRRENLRAAAEATNPPATTVVLLPANGRGPATDTRPWPRVNRTGSTAVVTYRMEDGEPSAEEIDHLVKGPS